MIYARQGSPHGSWLRQDAELEEGHRDPREGDNIDFFAESERRAEPWVSRHYKPTSPARRYYTGSDFKELTKGTKPEKSLLEHQTRTGGRNTHGRITSRFRGGGHKQRYRIIDWKRIDGQAKGRQVNGDDDNEDAGDRPHLRDAG